MVDLRPFRGLRFTRVRNGLGSVLCPPYDVIDSVAARRLRKNKKNAIHLELPAGGAGRYQAAARLWKKWLSEGILIVDHAPAIYVSEEIFSQEGKTRRRTGFFAALGFGKSIVRHEKTLSKPKADRLKMLKSVRANISPIFGLYKDSSGAARRWLELAKRDRPLTQGHARGIHYRLWKVSDLSAIAILCRLMRSKEVLIADGHHRYEVARNYYESLRVPSADTVLSYFCAEEDSGLVLRPTHRVVSAENLLQRAQSQSRLTPCSSLKSVLSKLSNSKNPYAYGLYDHGLYVAEPRSSGGCRSGLSVEWIAKNILKGVDGISYTPVAQVAMARARQQAGCAVFVKPMRIDAIRRAVGRVGLLPPKSTYFLPKVATGLVFKSLQTGGT